MANWSVEITFKNSFDRSLLDKEKLSIFDE